MVRIYDNGWGTDSKYSYQKSINLDSAGAIEKLDEVIERMNVCLKTKKRKEKKSEMCDYCGTYPHHVICPNYDDNVQILGVCSVCGQEIVEYDKIFQINENEAIHADCVQGFTPEEVFTLLDIDPSQTFRNSDIEGSVFLELFGIRKEEAH